MTVLHVLTKAESDYLLLQHARCARVESLLSSAAIRILRNDTSEAVRLLRDASHAAAVIAASLDTNGSDA